MGSYSAQQWVILAILLVVHIGHAYPGDRQRASETNKARHWRPGYTYTFDYVSQTAAGMRIRASEGTDCDDGKQVNGSDQRAITRFAARVRIQLDQSASSADQWAIMQLERVRVGSARLEVEGGRTRIQPGSLFEKSPMDEEKSRKLELPVRFQFNKGIVERLQFAGQDKPWAKNLKRAVLNMLQVNLGKRKQDGDMEKQYGAGSFGDQKHFQQFTLPETTLEGDCLVSYSVEKDNQEQAQNVSKRIHFRHCHESPTVSFGFQPNNPQCLQCPQFDRPSDTNARTTTPCPADCEVESVEEVLERTTTIRHQLTGTSANNYGTQRVKLHSSYRFISPESSYGRPKEEQSDPEPFEPILQVEVVAELRYRSSQSTEEMIRMPDGNEEESQESLLYDSADSIQQKRMYMYGDEDRQTSKAFTNMKNKAEQAHQLIQKVLQESVFEKTKGISSQATIHLQQLVEMVRKCSVKDIEEIYEQVQRSGEENESGDESGSSNSLRHTPPYKQQKNKANQLLDDCMATAGTRNALFVLGERIKRQQISPAKAALALKAVAGAMHSPSDEQAKILLQLCEHEAVRGMEVARQSCWLTTGALIGEVCRYRPDSIRRRFGNGKEKMCSVEKQQRYAEVIRRAYDSAISIKDKLLMLKATGNAGLESSLPYLERIITTNTNNDQSRMDKDSQSLIQMTAIDALRRIKKQKPKRVSAILLPVFMDKGEDDRVRITAFWQLMGCRPIQSVVIDQIAEQMRRRDESPQVYAFVRTTWKAMSKSKAEDKTAQRLTSILKELPTPSAYHGSRIFAFRLTPKHDYAGNPLALGLMSAYSRTSPLPSMLSAKLGMLQLTQPTQSTMPHGHSLPDSMEIQFTQANMEKWYEQVVMSLAGSSGNTSNPEWAQHPRQEYESIKDKLSIRHRQAPKHADPLAVFSVRIDDIDHSVCMVDEKSVWEMGNAVFGSMDKTGKLNIAMSIGDKGLHIGTSGGMPLKIAHSLLLMATIRGSIKKRGGNADSKQDNIQLQVQPTIAVSHIHSMEVSTPILSSGVENVQSMELNLPIDLRLDTSVIENDKEQGIRLTLRSSQPTQMTNLLTLRTLPTIYTKPYDTQAHADGNVQSETIRHDQMADLLSQANNTHGQFLFSGYVHEPIKCDSSAMDCLNKVVEVMGVTDNHLQIQLLPQEEDREEDKTTTLTITGKSFEKLSKEDLVSSLAEFAGFYSNWERMERRQGQTGEQLQSKLDARREQIVKKDAVFRHWLKMKLRFRNTKEKEEDFAGVRVRSELECDDKLHYCSVGMEMDCKEEMKRAIGPLRHQIIPDWAKVFRKSTVKGKYLLPDLFESVEELEEARKKDNKFLSMIALIKMDCVNERRDNNQAFDDNMAVKARIHAEPDYRDKQRPIINKLDMKMEQTMRFASAYRNPNDGQVVPSGIIIARTQEISVVVDVDRQKANYSIDQTGPGGLNQRGGEPMVIEMEHRWPMPSLLHPPKARAVRSVRMVEQRVDSRRQLAGLMRNGVRQQCSFDGQSIHTFDQVAYDAPLSRCYSVLAKDCSDSTQPRFVVMMKRIGSEGGDDYKLKVLTSEETIVVLPKQTKQANFASQEVDRQAKELEVKINGDAYDSTQQQSVRFSRADKSEVEISTPDLTIWFTGKQVWISMSAYNKHSQCGLCGHYDGQQDDEFQSADQNQNEEEDESGRIRNFHRSYSVVQPGEDDKCDTETMDSFYNNKAKFSRGRKSGLTQKKDDWQMSGERKRHKHGESMEPIRVTKVAEHKQKVCFSLSQVNKCPSGSAPMKTNNNNGDSMESDDSDGKALKTVSVEFGCVERAEPGVRKMLNVAYRQGKQAGSKAQEEREWLAEKVATLQPTHRYTQQLEVPEMCRAY